MPNKTLLPLRVPGLLADSQGNVLSLQLVFLARVPPQDLFYLVGSELLETPASATDKRWAERMQLY